MNTKVTVTGMQVRTQVSSNVFVAESTLATTAKEAEANFGPSVNFTTAATLLEPVSSIDGLNFFYVDASNNVDAVGAVKEADEYIAYNTGKAAPTSSQEEDFVAKNGTAGSKGFVDFVIQLKAVNANTSVAALKLTKLDLAYKGVAVTEKAFRVAIFMEKFDGSAFTVVSPQTLPAASSIFSKGAASDYFTDGKAVNGTDSLASVLTLNSTVSVNVAAQATEYYKVVIRIWLEGEDESCNNDTFASLNQNWALDLNFELGTATSPVAALGGATVTATSTGVTLTGTNSDTLSNGEIASEFAWYDATNGSATGDTTSSAPSSAGKYYCIVTTNKGNTYISDTITVS